ncbi:hypothetical protein FJZ26_00155 [Candidatus Parvarchaeota archaeon]|nr:hypothetical protein [Candidatus Parvarchaeota archaeon]
MATQSLETGTLAQATANIIGGPGADGPLQAVKKKDGFNIEKIVSHSDWRQVLYDLVSSQQLDPWNIDVVFVAGEYIKRIKQLSRLDLHLSANIVLAASILLRFKSDAIKFEEPVAQQTLGDFMGGEEWVDPSSLSALELSDRIPPKRQVTLDELVGALEQAFEFEKQRMERKSAIQTRLAPPLTITLPEFDIDAEMERIMEKISALKDAQGLVLFSALCKSKEPLDVIYALLPTLHLVQSSKLALRQEEFFGDIILCQLPPAQAKQVHPMQGPANTDSNSNSVKPAAKEDVSSARLNHKHQKEASPIMASKMPIIARDRQRKKGA